MLGQAASIEQTVELVERKTPEIVLVDVASADILSEFRALAARSPEFKAVAIGIEERASTVMECAEAGIVGYVDRHASAIDVCATVREVASGELRCSPRVAAALMRRVARLSSDGRGSGNGGGLTERETEIVRLVDQGRTNKEIALQLNIATATVRNHVHNILEKLGARTRSEAASIARRSLAI